MSDEAIVTALTTESDKMEWFPEPLEEVPWKENDSNQGAQHLGPHLNSPYDEVDYWEDDSEREMTALYLARARAQAELARLEKEHEKMRASGTLLVKGKFNQQNNKRDNLKQTISVSSPQPKKHNSSTIMHRQQCPPNIVVGSEKPLPVSLEVCLHLVPLSPSDEM